MSTKFDKRLDKLEEQITASGQLPKDARGPYVSWGDDDFSAIKKELVRKYGTYQGAEFVCVKWDNPAL